jgi:hypothetical protein
VTPRATYHALAEGELNEVAGYYASRDRPGLGEAFLSEVARVVTFLSANPHAGAFLAALSEAGSSRSSRIR